MNRERIKTYPQWCNTVWKLRSAAFCVPYSQAVREEDVSHAIWKAYVLREVDKFKKQPISKRLARCFYLMFGLDEVKASFSEESGREGAWPRDPDGKLYAPWGPLIADLRARLDAVPKLRWEAFSMGRWNSYVLRAGEGRPLCEVFFDDDLCVWVFDAWGIETTHHNWTTPGHAMSAAIDALGLRGLVVETAIADNEKGEFQ